MNGFIISGKAFTVCEDLRQIAEQYKGKTVAEVVAERKAEHLKRVVGSQLEEIAREVRNAR